MRKLRQKTAAAMVAVMAMTSVFSAVAGTVGTPSRGTKKINVTFDARGGYWLTEASPSDASSSNASSSDSEQEPVRQEKLTKTFTRLDWDDQDCRFTNLSMGREEFGDVAEWDEVQYKDGYDNYGWYYNSSDGLIPVFDNTEIYSDVTLVAEWYKNAQVKVEDVEGLALAPAGLGEREITVKPAENKTNKELQELVAQLPVKYELEEGTGVFGLNIELKGSGSGKVTLTMNVPAVLDPEKPIRAIHIKNDGKAEVLPVDVCQDDNFTWKMTFTASSFSPFYFVNGKEMFKIKIDNVENGYIAAYTSSDDIYEYYIERTFLPIGEEVELPAGTKIYYDAWGYELEDKYGKLESLSLIDMDTKEKEIISGDEAEWGSIVLEKNCELQAKFKLEDYEDASEWRGDKFILWVEPSGLKDKGVYQGTPHVRIWNEETKKYQEISEFSLRVPTDQEVGESGASVNSWEFFDYDAEKNILTSKEELPIGGYGLPFVIHFEGKDYLYEEREHGYGTDRHAYRLTVQVGAAMDFYHSYIKFNDRYETYDEAGGQYLSYRKFAYSDGMTWSRVEEVLKEEPLQSIPKMYNYEFKGWQTQTGVEYKPDTRLVKAEDDEMYYTSFTVFKNAEGKKYEVKAMVEGGSSATQPGNQGGNNPGSGSSGGSGGRDRRNADLTKQYAMTGSWIVGEDGWKFRTSSGEFATNTWGWINSQWYFFDSTGKMVTGWYQVNGKWYYMNPAEGSMQGAMVTGWNLDLNYQAWFFLKENGEMATGWQQIAGKWYYFNPISDGRMGAMAMNTYVDSYYVGADGAWIPAS